MENKNNFKRQDIFLALAALTKETGGVLLCVMTILLGKKLLPAWLVTGYMFLGGLFALAFLTIYFCIGSSGDEKAFRKIKNHWLDVLEPELWMAAVYYLWRLLNGAWRLISGRYLSDGVLYIAVSVLLALAAVFAGSLFLQRLLKAYGENGRKKGVSHIFRTFALMALSLAALAALSFLWEMLSGLLKPTVISMFASHIFIACCEYGLVRLLLAVLCRGKAEESLEPCVSSVEGAPASSVTPAEEMPVAPSVVFVRRFAGAGIPFVVVLVLVFVTGERLFLPSAVERAVSIVETSVRESYASLEEGKLEKALQHFERAERRLLAFRSLASDEAVDSLLPIYRENPDDVVIGALYLSESDAVEEIETAIWNYALGREWYPVLLRYYGEQSSLGSGQEFLRDELLLECIAMGQYIRSDCVFAQDLRGNKIELRQKLRNYEGALRICGVLRLVARYDREGVYTEKMAYEALDLAEEYPDNLLLQYAACQIAGNYRVDGARHYSRTIEAVARFDRLYDDNKKMDAQIANEKLFLGNVAANCYDYEAALGYYEESWQLSGQASVALSCAKIYDKLKDYEQCAQMAEGVLRKEPDNAQALYLKALSSLKTREIDAALEAAGKLGDLVADSGRAAEENSLYTFAQYLAMRDSSSWTDYNWAVYDSLSEEQVAAAQSHVLLWDYMTAVNQCFVKRDYELAGRAVENILAVRDDLPMGWYLRGTIAFDQQDFPKALEYFGKAIDCGCEAPAVYFSIANAYDAMEDYENAWVYAKLVEEMLPYQDHGDDVYGISIHNKNLLSALEHKLRR